MNPIKLYQKFLKEFFKGDSSSLFRKLTDYTGLLHEERKIRNIIGPGDIETIAKEHIIPSARLAAVIKETKGADIGTGAGLPGIVIAILYPQKDITLFEPRRSKVNFLLKVKNELGLANTEVAPLRAETAGRRGKYRESFLFITCRAVADLKISTELALPLLEKGGIFYAQKGKKLNREIKEAKEIIGILRGEIKKIRDEGTLMIRKTKESPKRYPRKWKDIIR